MNTTSHPFAAEGRRHQNPRCTCPDCAFFDQSVTLPICPLAKEGVIMTAIDTETSRTYTYYYAQGVLHPMPEEPSPRHTPEKKSGMKRSFRTLLHDLVMETIEQSVKSHPFFWLCVSSLLR